MYYVGQRAGPGLLIGGVNGLGLNAALELNKHALDAILDAHS